MISQTVEYSLRALVTLAFHHGQPVTVQHVSKKAKIPAPYLSKLMQTLVRAGLVRSRRGVGGGFVLSKEPAEITIWDIVQAVDPVKRIESCPLEIESHSGTLCPLHRRLDDALASTEQAFRTTTLDELLGDSPDKGPFCEESDVVPLDLTMPPRNN